MAALGVSRGDPSGRPPEVSFAVLKEAIIARTGHYYYADKDRLLRDRLDRRLKATGCTGLQDYLSLLNHPAAGAAEWQELEAEVTIGETFFFRHTEQFVALRDVILPAIVAQNQATRRLRLWSAGCAVGAEPYSLAILLERLLGEQMRDWAIDIVGSDINHRVLAQARDGRFSNWALRGMAEADRARDFTPLSDQRHWHIADRHRPHVRFVQHNLLTLLDDPPGWDWTGFDLILCRNVLIYFSPDRIAPMMSALARCLSPVGWLMVGHSDAIVALPRDLGIVDLPGTIAFRPPGCLPPPGEAGAPLLDIAAVMMGMERNHGANDDGALAPMPVRLPAPRRSSSGGAVRRLRHGTRPRRKGRSLRSAPWPMAAGCRRQRRPAPLPSTRIRSTRACISMTASSPRPPGSAPMPRRRSAAPSTCRAGWSWPITISVFCCWMARRRRQGGASWRRC